jgi:hypothetical protein
MNRIILSLVIRINQPVYHILPENNIVNQYRAF